jgi:type II secretory pathway component PulF
MEKDKDAKILMRQTSYTLEECLEILKTKTIEDAIKDFLGIIEKKDESGSTNQKIFKSIRDFKQILKS